MIPVGQEEIRNIWTIIAWLGCCIILGWDCMALVLISPIIMMIILVVFCSFFFFISYTFIR